MYQSTWVKATMRGASVRAVRAPVFVDRCAGLHEAVADAEDAASVEFAAYLESFGAVLAAARKGST